MRGATPINFKWLGAAAAIGALLWVVAGRQASEILIDYGFSWSPSLGQALALLVSVYVVEFPAIFIAIELSPADSFADGFPPYFYALNGAFWGSVAYFLRRFIQNRLKKRATRRAR